MDYPLQITQKALTNKKAEIQPFLYIFFEASALSVGENHLSS